MPQQPIPPHRQLKRRGLPNMTGPMRDALAQLRDAVNNDTPFLALPEVDPRTIRALEDRDWIVAAPPKFDLTHYTITGRGLHALKVYEPMVKRTDGICPRCNERPRATRSTGKPSPYCQQCMNRLGRLKYRLGLYRLKGDGLCTRCKVNPRYVASTGRAYVHCQQCKNEVHREEHKRQRAELLERIQAGEFIPCGRQGCDQPRYVTGKTVQDYCYAHYREYHNNRHHRMMAEKRGANADH